MFVIIAAVFYTKYKMDLHLSSNHGINDQFKCEKYGKFLMSEWSLLKYKRKCSTNPCPVCRKEFLSKWKLGNHVKGHLYYRSHICDECGKDFLHSFTLVEHIEIVHQGKRGIFNAIPSQKHSLEKGPSGLTNCPTLG